jgi:hypothetical protein
LESPAVNIGPRERRKRRVMGITALAAGALTAFALVASEAPRLSRLIIFFPIWIAAIGLLQAREKTCIALAARGTCNMDEGEERIDDERLVGELRGAARRINRRAIMTAVIVTAVALAFPK